MRRGAGLWLCLVGVLGLMGSMGTCSASKATANRILPAVCLASNEVFEVSLNLWVTNPPPAALILAETLPEGWALTNATWNGNPLPPSLIDGTYKWLFGLGTPVGGGVLTYEAKALGPPGAIYAMTGSVLHGTTIEHITGSALVRVCPSADTDEDGMPDEWELRHGLDPEDPSDAALHGDSDGDTNLQEYLVDTNPTNSLSRLMITEFVREDNEVVVGWKSGSKAIQYLESTTNIFSSGSWELHRMLIPPTGITNRYAIPESEMHSYRYYRIRALR